MNDFRALSAEISERTTRSELHQSINNNIKPLVTALNSLESALAIQENSSRQQQTVFQERASMLEKMVQEQTEYRLKNTLNSSGQAPASVDKVYAIVEDVIKDRRLGEVNMHYIVYYTITSTYTVFILTIFYYYLYYHYILYYHLKY